ncbi:hypothetical protein P280DRAFT_468656 [Massarina eburnea CBS 473.64]|uniref:Transmembrane protein n=1 Tax=Massarina eburnea CBS 473.64 TaxID=1395130 RepID=A0A6A6S665_9PLEO|nr:hypothetical protein P280DRAFT_468656 [Massarina eburnea CBS 473.64]
MALSPFVLSWAPLQIDALGMVTMLGADQVNTYIGRMTYSCITDMLPLLGTFVIAGNKFAEPIPGFVLYNITDGIIATDLAGWFARWLLCQDLTPSKSTIEITITKRPRRPAAAALAYTIGLCVVLPPILISILGHDWWGLGNSLCMLFSCFVRKIVIEMCKDTLDDAAEEAEKTDCEPVKVFLTMPTGQGVTIRTSRSVIINCLLTEPRTTHRKFYDTVRGLGWLTFGCQVVALGMSSFLIQLLTVVVMVSATVLATRGVGDDETRIGQRLLLKRSEYDGTGFRAKSYARLDLKDTEEDSMVHWNMFPRRSNSRWWETYRKCLAEDNKRFDTWDQRLKNQQVPE